MRNLQMLSTKWFGTLTLGAGLALAPIGASALTITSADLPSGETSVILPGATVSASPGVFVHKTIAGYDMAGILGGYENGEIDLDDEAMTFQFDAPSVVNTLDLGALFAAVEEDDLYNEMAKVTVYVGELVYEYTLSVMDGTNAIWSGSGTVSNVSPATFGNAAVWSITNPFGDLAIDAMVLSGIGPDAPTDYRNNDYGFVSLSATPVPEPGTVSLMALGMAGLGFAGRKRRS